MTETKHIPGPYRFEGGLILAGERTYIASVDSIGVVEGDALEACIATARLLVSAPDMAEEITRLRAERGEMVRVVEEAEMIAAALYREEVRNLKIKGQYINTEEMRDRARAILACIRDRDAGLPSIDEVRGLFSREEGGETPAPDRERREAALDELARIDGEEG